MSTLSRIAGSIKISGAPVSRRIIVIRDVAGNCDVLAEGVSESDGSFDISYAGWGGRVIAMAVDNYGDDFSASRELSVGDVVHPTIPNGYIYNVTVAGITGASEPVWATDSSITSGSVTLVPAPYYRPLASGPLQGEVITNRDPFWSSVVSLQQFDNDVIDVITRMWTANGGASISGGFLTIDAAGATLSTPRGPDFYWWTGGPFTIETYIIPIAYGADINDRPTVIGDGLANPGILNWSFGLNATGKVSFFYWGGSIVTFSGVTTLALLTEHHIAMTFDGSVIKLWVNGRLDATLDYSIAIVPATQTGVAVRIGMSVSGARFRGALRGFRVTRALRYTEDFTPPSLPLAEEG